MQEIYVYQRHDWQHCALGRRIVERLSGGRMQLSPGIVPELINWLRLVGNRYVKLLENFTARSLTKGDAYLNSIRQTTEYRIALIQDLINSVCEKFPYHDWLVAWSATCTELDITDQDCDPNLFVPVELFQDGEGI